MRKDKERMSVKLSKPHQIVQGRNVQCIRLGEHQIANASLSIRYRKSNLSHSGVISFSRYNSVDLSAVLVRLYQCLTQRKTRSRIRSEKPFCLDNFLSQIRVRRKTRPSRASSLTRVNTCIFVQSGDLETFFFWFIRVKSKRR